MADVEITSSFDDEITPGAQAATQAIEGLGDALGKLAEAESTQRTLLDLSSSLGRIAETAQPAATGLDGLIQSLGGAASDAAERFSGVLEKVVHAGLEPLEKIAPTAAHAIEGLVESMGPAGQVAVTFVAALVAGSDTLLKIAESAAAAGVELEHLHLRTGAAVDDLQALNLAAEKAGLGANSIGMAFRFMERSIDGAVQGTGRAGAAFTRLGLSIDDVMKMNPTEQLTTIARALDAVADPAQKGALAMQLFGRQGQSMIPMFHEIAEGVDKLKESLPFVFTPAMTENAHEFHSAMVDLSNTTTSFATALGVRLLPTFTDVANAINDAMKAVLQWEESSHIFERISTIVGVAGDLIVKTFQTIGTAIGNVRDMLNWISEHASDAMKTFQTSMDSFHIPVAVQKTLEFMANPAALFNQAGELPYQGPRPATIDKEALGLGANATDQQVAQAIAAGEALKIANQKNLDERKEATQKHYEDLIKLQEESHLKMLESEAKMNGQLERAWEEQKALALRKADEKFKAETDKLNEAIQKQIITEQQGDQARTALEQQHTDDKLAIENLYIEKKRALDAKILADEQTLAQKRLENEIALNQSKLRLQEEIQKTGHAQTTTVVEALKSVGSNVEAAETHGQQQQQDVQDQEANEQAKLDAFIQTQNLMVQKADATAALMATKYGQDSEQFKKAQQEQVMAHDQAENLILDKTQQTIQTIAQLEEHAKQVQIQNIEEVANARMKALEDAGKLEASHATTQETDIQNTIDTTQSGSSSEIAVNTAQAEADAAHLRAIGDEVGAQRELAQTKIDNLNIELSTEQQVYALKVQKLQVEQTELQNSLARQQAELAIATQAQQDAAEIAGIPIDGPSKKMQEIQLQIDATMRSISTTQKDLVVLSDQHVGKEAQLNSQLDIANVKLSEIHGKWQDIPKLMSDATKETDAMVQSWTAVMSAVNGAAGGIKGIQNQIDSLMTQISNIGVQQGPGMSQEQKHQLDILGLELQKANIEGDKERAAAIQKNIDAINLESINRQLAANQTDQEAQQAMQRAQQRAQLENQLNAATQSLNDQMMKLGMTIAGINAKAINQAVTTQQNTGTGFSPAPGSNQNSAPVAPLFQTGLLEGPSPGGMVHTEPGEVIATQDQARGILTALSTSASVAAAAINALRNISTERARPSPSGSPDTRVVNVGVTMAGLNVVQATPVLQNLADTMGNLVADRVRRGW